MEETIKRVRAHQKCRVILAVLVEPEGLLGREGIDPSRDRDHSKRAGIYVYDTQFLPLDRKYHLGPKLFQSVPEKVHSGLLRWTPSRPCPRTKRTESCHCTGTPPCRPERVHPS